jgi:hypothetical protein
MKFLIILSFLALSSIASANLDRSQLEVICDPVNPSPTAVRAEIGPDPARNSMVAVVSIAMYRNASTIPTHIIKKAYPSGTSKIYHGEKFTLVVDQSKYNSQLGGFLGTLICGKKSTAQVVSCKFPN